MARIDTPKRLDAKTKDLEKACHLLEAEQSSVLAFYLPLVLWDVCLAYASDSKIADVFEWMGSNPTKIAMGLFWICGFFGGTHQDHPTVPLGFFAPRIDPCGSDPCGRDPCGLSDRFLFRANPSLYTLNDCGYSLVRVGKGMGLYYEVGDDPAKTTSEIIAVIWGDGWAWLVTQNGRYLVDTHGMANIHLLPASPVRWVSDM